MLKKIIQYFKELHPLVRDLYLLEAMLTIMLIATLWMGRAIWLLNST